MVFATISGSLLYSFNDKWQVGASIPFQYRNIGIDYSLTSTGESYTPPYAGLHHRNEVLYGFGDAEIYGQRFFATEALTVGVFAGTTVPLGRTEEDPYLLAAVGEEHQHFQMGTGTFIPMASVMAFYTFNNQGLIGQARGEFSLYENAKFYKTGSALRWDVGYWRKMSSKVMLLGQVGGEHEQPDTWRDLRAPFSGRHALSASLSSTVRFRPKWEWLFRVEQLLWVQEIAGDIEEEGAGFPKITTFSVGISWM